MTRVDSGQPLVPSLLERLLDREPDVSTEPAWSRAQGLREFTETVRSDIEALLNTRQAWSNAEDGYEELDQSTLAYGLADLSSLDVVGQEGREHLISMVERVIERFEPRLRQVRVTLREPANKVTRTITLVIEAQLRVEPTPEEIVFETDVEPSTGKYNVTSR